MLDTRYRLSGNHVPTDLRSTANAGLNGGQRVRKLVLTDLTAMTRAARKAGAPTSSCNRPIGATRPSARPSATGSPSRAMPRALKESARAGHSEHQLGTTIDFRSAGGVRAWDYADWGTTKAGTWLRKYAWKYGFVMSYPKGKTSVTCYAYEPWHYRYVGRTVAKKVHDSGLTLREYLWKQQNAPAPTPSVEPTPSPDPTPSAEPTPSPDPTPVPPSEDPPAP